LSRTRAWLVDAPTGDCSRSAGMGDGRRTTTTSVSSSCVTAPSAPRPSISARPFRPNRNGHASPTRPEGLLGFRLPTRLTRRQLEVGRLYRRRLDRGRGVGAWHQRNDGPPARTHRRPSAANVSSVPTSSRSNDEVILSVVAGGSRRVERPGNRAKSARRVGHQARGPRESPQLGPSGPCRM
jgi:hypothetical protein